MTKSEYERKLSQGRKAGLNARELNSALAGRAPAGDGRPDSNGFVWILDERGQIVCRPLSDGQG